MPSTGSPLTDAQTEGDHLKLLIDEFVLSCKILDEPGVADKEKQREQLQKQCKDLISTVTKLEKKVSKLKKSQEPSTTSRFEEKKKDEAIRLASFKSQLEGIRSTMEADELEQDYLRNFEENNNLEGSVSEDDDCSSAVQIGKGGGPVDDKTSRATKSRFGRLGIFRRSKSPGKDLRSKVKEGTVVPGNTGREQSGKKGIVKSRKDRRKRKNQENNLQERKEIEKKAVKDIKREEEAERKEQKRTAAQKDEGIGIGRRQRVKGSIRSADDVFGENDPEEALNTGRKRSEEEFVDEDVVSEDDASQDDCESSSDEEPDEVKFPVTRKNDTGGRGWLLRSITPNRKQKAELNKEQSNSKGGKKQPVKDTKNAGKPTVLEEDEDHSSYDDSEEGESEYEDEEEGESDDELVVVPTGGPSGSSRGQPEAPKGHPGSAGEQASLARQDAVAGEDDDLSVEDEEEEEYESGEEEEEEGDLEDEEELETGSSEEEGDLPPEGEHLFTVLCDFEGEEPTDLPVKQGDVVTILSTREDGWWMAEDEEGNKGLLPSTYLKLKRGSVDSQAAQSPEPDHDADEFSPRSGKELWKSVRKTVHETITSDVLSAMGAIPAGFRQSTTAKLLSNDQYKLSSFLKPNLSESGLSFKDLLWDPQTRQLRSVPCRIQKMLSLVLVRNMPAMGTGLETKCRHARIAIFNGKEVLSNIHTVQATWNEADLKTWRFSPRVSGIMPSILDGDCFVRTDRSEKNIGLLIELCVSYVRTRTGEQGELSCGWVHLPLYNEETGGPILNKLYELPVQGGTPFEQGVEVDPTISRKASTNKFRSMLTSNKQPRIHIKFVAPSKEQKTQLEMLPFTIVGVASYLPLLSFYRRILADAVLRDRIDTQSTELIHSPLLANFPKAADLPDVMDGLRSMWNEKMRSTKKSEKRDGEQMKSLFTLAFMESAYPLLYSATLTPYKWPGIETGQIRWEGISNFIAASHQKGILTALLIPGKTNTPFHTSEVTYDILGAYTNR